MPDPILPTIIQGPAAVIHDGYTYYTKGNIVERLEQESFNVESDFHGVIDERKASQLTTISFTPVGEIESLAKYFPWGPADVGSSIFTGSNKNTVIHTKAGLTVTYPRTGVLRNPLLRLRPRETLFGEMTIAAIGSASVQQTDAAFWRTIGSAAFSDTGFSEAVLLTDLYQAAYGLTPYDAMGGINGFELELGVETTQVPADDVGIADIVISSLVGKARFIPSNLTQAQVDTLLAAQNTAAVFPGQSFSKANTDLVIIGSGKGAVTLSATLHKAGPKGYEAVYGIGQHRHRGVEFTSKRTWQAGVADPLWTLSVS